MPNMCSEEKARNTAQTQTSSEAQIHVSSLLHTRSTQPPNDCLRKCNDTVVTADVRFDIHLENHFTRPLTS